MSNLQIMDVILEILAVLLLINGIALRKNKWGQRILWFSLGMIAVFLLRRFLPFFLFM